MQKGATKELRCGKISDSLVEPHTSRALHAFLVPSLDKHIYKHLI